MAVQRQLHMIGLALLWLCFATISPSLAQTSDPIPGQLHAAQQVLEAITASDETVTTPQSGGVDANQLQLWAQALDDIESDLLREQPSINVLAVLRDRATSVRDEIQAYVDTLAPRLEEQRALLTGLTPSEGELVETPQIQAQRERITELERELQPAELLLGRSAALRDDAITQRSIAFTNALFERAQSLVSPTLWIEGAGNLPQLAQRLADLVTTSLSAVQGETTPASFAGLGVLLLLVIVFAIPLRRFALKRAARSNEHHPSAFEKTLGALRIVALSAGVPIIGFAVLLTAIDTVGGLSLRAQSILNALSINIVLYFLISGIIRAFLAPGLPQWRLVPVANGFAGRAAVALYFAAFSYVTGEVLRTTAAVFVSPLEVVQLLETVPVLMTGLAVLAAMRSLLRGLAAYREQQSEDTLLAPDPPTMAHILWRWTLPVAALVAFGALTAQIFGFLALAAFLVDRLVWTAVVLAALRLASQFVEGATNATFQEETRTATWVQDNIGLSPKGLGQFGVLLSGIIKLVLIIIAATLVIAPFGVETGAITDIFRSVFTGIQIGGFSFSLSSIFIALGMVFIGVVATRGIQGWLENRYLPRTSLDTGLKASIRTSVGYVGIILAAMVGLSYVGLNLENLALVAGALSVGIGFGLQSIVSNFVSGLILLAERPFKAGDWIVVGEEQGIVKRINVRATELQTFDRATVLIPNSDFIAGTVKNRVHRDTLGRIDIPVGVGYDSDPAKVKEVLLEVANAHPQTLSYPEPAAFFIEFGASSLDFMLFAYLADVGNGYGVRSDIRFEIFRRFKEEGIEIPFAQSDVTIRNLDKVLDALSAAGIALPEGLGASGLTTDTDIETSGVRTVPVPDRTVEDAPDASPDEGPIGR